MFHSSQYEKIQNQTQRRRHWIKMNTRNLVTSLSQQLDTSCTDFPDGFEETQQIQVSLLAYTLFSLIFYTFTAKLWMFHLKWICLTDKSLPFNLGREFSRVLVKYEQRCAFYRIFSASRIKRPRRCRAFSQAICLNKCKNRIALLLTRTFLWSLLCTKNLGRERERTTNTSFQHECILSIILSTQSISITKSIVWGWNFEQQQKQQHYGAQMFSSPNRRVFFHTEGAIDSITYMKKIYNKKCIRSSATKCVCNDEDDGDFVNFKSYQRYKNTPCQFWWQLSGYSTHTHPISFLSFFLPSSHRMSLWCFTLQHFTWKKFNFAESFHYFIVALHLLWHTITPLWLYLCVFSAHAHIVTDNKRGTKY